MSFDKGEFLEPAGFDPILITQDGPTIEWTNYWESRQQAIGMMYCAPWRVDEPPPKQGVLLHVSAALYEVEPRHYAQGTACGTIARPLRRYVRIGCRGGHVRRRQAGAVGDHYGALSFPGRSDS
jgi:hypothetical protein